MEELDIIIEYLESLGEYNTTAESLIKWFSTDDIVEWFVKCYFANDTAELKEALDDDKKASQILDYFDLHCRERYEG